MADAVSAFQIPRINLKPIPTHKRGEYRRRFGGDIIHHCRQNGIKNLHELSKKTKVPYPLLVALSSGRVRKDDATYEILNKIARALSCELILNDAEGREGYGATTTFEEFLRIGIWPQLVSINGPQ